ncbi:centrosomal protein of 295 kDa-like [Oncorhynchus nerka]|uniref:centrosomal protein of 295 kDa-like n=1 Tax=Oncorhynchus nerka TaxID=8023 RepID=UPI0031B82724
MGQRLGLMCCRLLLNRVLLSLSSVSEAKLKKVGEVRISTPEIRKQDVAEMHKRTERLYSRLDEVKLQKEVRSRQVAYANNREKAKEFHTKTLQKLRAKQSSQ